MLDTNICSAIINEHPQAEARFYPIFSQCCLSTIVMAELYKSAYSSQKVEANLRKIHSFINLISTIVQFDENAAIEFAKIQGELKVIGRPTEDIDALIAAVARCHGYILVTHNTRHFINIPRLQLEDWLE
nr:type II toxin-antitoxin system VapC family toxin [Argonema antarcticum]